MRQGEPDIVVEADAETCCWASDIPRRSTDFSGPRIWLRVDVMNPVRCVIGKTAGLRRPLW